MTPYDEGQADRLSFEEALDLLSAEERRRVVQTLLQEEDDAVHLPADPPITGSTSRETMLRLHHVHLPRLVDAGVIAWDRDAERISRGPQFAELRALVEVLQQREDDLPWQIR